jgi:hypothetical protein
MEKGILNEFKERFDNIAGNEFFEGDLLQMRKLFLKFTMDNIDQTCMSPIDAPKRDRLQERRDRLQFCLSEDLQILEVTNPKLSKAFEQIIACKKLINHVFGIFDGDYCKLNNPDIEYKNKVWKPRLVEYVKGMKQPELLLTLKLFKMRDNLNSKGQVTSYKNVNEYSKTGSKLPFNMVKTMINTTFGIQFVPADKMCSKMKFINGSTDTILHKSTTGVEIDDDFDAPLQE